VTALVVAVGVVAAALAWHHVASGDQGVMTARVLLSGSPCHEHQAACARLAHGGSVVVFGPIVEGSASYPRHVVRLDASDSRLRLRLDPGLYSFAFFIRPPWGTLLPSFGQKQSGAFRITAHRTTDLGVVRPSTGWIVVGD
jgi:hypothetical protein